jgi:hypothetical protein
MTRTQYTILNATKFENLNHKINDLYFKLNGYDPITLVLIVTPKQQIRGGIYYGNMMKWRAFIS